MNRLSWHGFLQVLASAAQVANLVLPVVPGPYKAAVTTVIAVVQVILHQFAYNDQPPKEKP